MFTSRRSSDCRQPVLKPVFCSVAPQTPHSQHIGVRRRRTDGYWLLWGLHFATCIWRRTDARVGINRRRSGDADRCGDLRSASFSFWTKRIYMWHAACTLPEGANLGNSGPDRGGDTIKCSAGSELPYIYRRWSRSLRSQCGDLGIRDLRSIYDPRRPVFAKHSPRYGVARSLRGLCPEHGGNRSDFPLSEIW